MFKSEAAIKSLGTRLPECTCIVARVNALTPVSAGKHLVQNAFLLLQFPILLSLGEEGQTREVFRLETYTSQLPLINRVEDDVQ